MQGAVAATAVESLELHGSQHNGWEPELHADRAVGPPRHLNYLWHCWHDSIGTTQTAGAEQAHQICIGVCIVNWVAGTLSHACSAVRSVHGTHLHAQAAPVRVLEPAPRTRSSSKRLQHADVPRRPILPHLPAPHHHQSPCHCCQTCCPQHVLLPLLLLLLPRPNPAKPHGWHWLCRPVGPVCWRSCCALHWHMCCPPCCLRRGRELEVCPTAKSSQPTGPAVQNHGNRVGVARWMVKQGNPGVVLSCYDCTPP